MTEQELTGYVDRWSARAGETLTFYVSCKHPRFDVELVKLRHGDDNRHGPGVRETPIASTLSGSHTGREQRVATGSYMRVSTLPALPDFTFAAWIWPTLLNGREQCIFSRGTHSGDMLNCAVLLDSTATPELRTIGPAGISRIRLGEPLQERHWTFLAISLTRDGRAYFYRTERDYSPLRAQTVDAQGTLEPALTSRLDGQLLLATQSLEPQGRLGRPTLCFNGKVSAPVIFATALQRDDMDRLVATGSLECASPLARWNFAARSDTELAPDVTGNGHDASTHNRPARWVSGHNYSGRTQHPAGAPEEFNAAHFHEDDLSDSGWEPSFQFTVPNTLSSGIYAARLSAGDQIDHIPFIVRGGGTAAYPRIAVLLPTFSYMAYANITLAWPSVQKTPAHNYVLRNGLKSLYDVHADGSGVHMATMLRPLLSHARPRYRSLLTGGPHQLSADLHLIDWLETKEIAYEVLTDHDLHREGVGALARYRAVLSGTHAEYWSGAMLDALDRYQKSGGRFVYLAGNGLYWVTALSNDGSVIEVRRTGGTRTWSAESGETYLSLSGEPGGLWRDRGRAPQRLVGVGFCAQRLPGPDFFEQAPIVWGHAYRRSARSYDRRAQFIFDGVEGELIGDVPNLVLQHGAVGFEIDRADTRLGTPEHALVLASATQLDDGYQNTVEEVGLMSAVNGGSTSPNVRADMVFFETAQDGAVFAVGSIGWCASLSANQYQNSISRITENVVRAFGSEGPLPGAATPRATPDFVTSP